MNKPRAILRKLMLLTVLMSMAFATQAQKNLKKTTTDTDQVLRFVRFNNVPIRALPSANSAIMGYVHRLEKIYTIPDVDSMFFKVNDPLVGFVNRLMVFHERDMEKQYIEAVDHMNELQLIASGKTPYDDIVSDWEGLPAFDLGRKWVDNGKHQIFFVEVDTLDVKTTASQRAKTLGSFIRGEKIIVDLSYNPQSNWHHVVFPRDGFVLKAFLMQQEEVEARLEYQKLVIEELEQALGIYREPEIELADSLLLEGFVTAEEIDRAYQYLDSILFGEVDPTGLTDSALLFQIDTTNFLQQTTVEELAEILAILPDSSLQLWWSDELDKDGNGFLEKANLNLLVNKPDEGKRFLPLLYFRPENGNSFRLYDLPPPKRIKNDKAVKWEIGDHELLNQDRYNFKLELLEPKTGELIATESNLNREALNLLNFEYAGAGKKGLQFSLMGIFSPYFIPVEQNFSRLSFPYGGQFEFSTKKLPISLGAGYNYQQAESSTGAFNLLNHSFFMYLKYVPITLLSDRFEPYIYTGGTYRMSQLRNVKYPDHDEYYPLELTKGFGYTGGIGGQFILRNFILGLQYQLFGTPLVIFGPDFNEPETQEDLDNYIPTTQYRFYPGTNQLQLVIGYRIQ